MSQRQPSLNDPQLAQALADLGRVSNTLLIPLMARATGGRIFPRFHPHDAHAAHLSHLLQNQLKGFVGDWATVLNVLWRTWLIKHLGESFFQRHPQAMGANLGAGLSHYFQWLDNQHNRWIDLDLDPVIRLRRLLFGHGSSHHSQKAINLKHDHWWLDAGLPKRQHKRPVFLICEGVSMYLRPEQLTAMLAEISAHAPNGSELVMDYISDLGVGRAYLHPAVGETGSEFRWGAHHIRDLCAQHPRIHLLEEHSVSEAYGAGASWMEKVLEPWLGGPMYGLARFEIRDPK